MLDLASSPLYVLAAIATIAGFVYTVIKGWPFGRLWLPGYKSSAWSNGTTKDGRLRVEYRITTPSHRALHIRGFSVAHPLSILTGSNNDLLGEAGIYLPDVKEAQYVPYDRIIPPNKEEGGTLVLVHSVGFLPDQEVSLRLHTDQGAKSLRFSVRRG